MIFPGKVDVLVWGFQTYVITPISDDIDRLGGTLNKPRKISCSRFLAQALESTALAR